MFLLIVKGLEFVVLDLEVEVVVQPMDKCIIMLEVEEDG